MAKPGDSGRNYTSDDRNEPLCHDLRVWSRVMHRRDVKGSLHASVVYYGRCYLLDLHRRMHIETRGWETDTVSHTRGIPIASTS